MSVDADSGNGCQRPNAGTSSGSPPRAATIPCGKRLLTSQAALGSYQVDYHGFPTGSLSSVESYLHPNYIVNPPTRDGWKTPYAYRTARTRGPLASRRTSSAIFISEAATVLSAPLASSAASRAPCASK